MNQKTITGVTARWLVTDPDGVEHTVHSLQKWCEDNGIKYQNFLRPKRHDDMYPGYQLELLEK